LRQSSGNFRLNSWRRHDNQLEDGARIRLVLSAKSERGNLSASQLLETRQAIDHATIR
jgi:hypothetical protein